jgi:hypothetical protein
MPIMLDGSQIMSGVGIALHDDAYRTANGALEILI